MDCATFAQQLGEPNDVSLVKVEPGSILAPGDVPKRIRVSNFWAQSGCETIWAACSDCVVRVWNGSDGRALRALRGHEDNVTAMEGLNNQGNLQSSSCLVATGSTDKTVRVWDVRARKVTQWLHPLIVITNELCHLALTHSFYLHFICFCMSNTLFS